MKQLILSFLLVVVLQSAFGQKPSSLLTGNVSFFSGPNVYVRFSSTAGIREGDSLFVSENDSLYPVLKVMSMSSVSCVSNRLTDRTLSLSQEIFARISPLHETDTRPDSTIIHPITPQIPDTATRKTVSSKPKTPSLLGRISLGSFSDFSDQVNPIHRQKLTLNFASRNMRGSGFSFESYLILDRRSNDSVPLRNDFQHMLRVYSLSINYEAKNWLISLGRRINPLVSGLGVVDGLQAQRKMGSTTLGVILGSRPDYADFGFNSHLFQFGAFVSRPLNLGSYEAQNTLSVIEQQNRGRTDRRFLFFQHTGNLNRKWSFFFASELDFYKKVSENEEVSTRLTNLNLSLRFNPSRRWNIALSYSERQPVIYYETFKTLVQILLEQEVNRGIQLNSNYKFGKIISVGFRAGYHQRKSEERPSKNIHAFLSLCQIPWLNATSTLSFTGLESLFLSGRIYNLGVSKNVLSDKAFLELNLKKVYYTYPSFNSFERQKVVEFSMNYLLKPKLILTAYVEATYSASDNHKRVFLQITRRF